VQLKIGGDSVKAVEELMKQQAVKLRIAERNLEKVREKLDEAVKDRKIHEKLKENAFEEFKVELNNEEKKEIDELVSFTYNDKSEADD
jgi:flagellar FliJ protein